MTCAGAMKAGRQLFRRQIEQLQAMASLGSTSAA
jgi:hypothetical protein